MPYCTDDPNVREDWLTVGSGRQLDGHGKHNPWTTRLLGQGLRWWRDGGTGGTVRCIDGDGRDLPVQTVYGYLWVCTAADPDQTPPPTLFALPEHAEPGRRIVDCGGIGVATSGLRVIENFLDMAHFPYVHPGTLGELPHTAVAPYRVAVDPDNGEIVATECRFYQPRASASAGGGIDAHYRYRVMQPFTAALYKSCPNRDGALDTIVLMVQPLDDEHSVAHVLLVYYEDDLGDAEMVAFQQMIFGQDRPILESQRPRRLPLVPGLEAHMRCDLTSTTYRRWLRERNMVFGTWTGEGDTTAGVAGAAAGGTRA